MTPGPTAFSSLASSALPATKNSSRPSRSATSRASTTTRPIARSSKTRHKGMRRGDPKLLIATCAVYARPSGPYHKNIATVKGLESLYDVINVHSYAEAEGYPTWR